MNGYPRFGWVDILRFQQPFKTNENNIIGRVYAQKVELLVRLKPIMLEEGLFAVHSGTTINIFLKDLPLWRSLKFPWGSANT